MSCDKYLSEIEERCKAATPGPWTTRFAKSIRYVVSLFDPDRVIGRAICMSRQKARSEDDFEFIAHSRTDIETLVKMVRCARESIFLSSIACMSHLDPNATGVLNVVELKAFLDKAIAELDRLSSKV